jgi:hypothetical protein
MERGVLYNLHQTIADIILKLSDKPDLRPQLIILTQALQVIAELINRLDSDVYEDMGSLGLTD